MKKKLYLCVRINIIFKTMKKKRKTHPKTAVVEVEVGLHPEVVPLPDGLGAAVADGRRRRRRRRVLLLRVVVGVKLVMGLGLLLRVTATTTHQQQEMIIPCFCCRRRRRVVTGRFGSRLCWGA